MPAAIDISVTGASPAVADDIGAFLAAFADLLLGNVLRLDETVGQVTDHVMSSKPSRETVVNLQSFDRLKQEFEALGEVMSRYARAHTTTPLSGEERVSLSQVVIAGITVADLQNRFVALLQEDLSDIEAIVISPEQAAEVGVDIEY